MVYIIIMIDPLLQPGDYYIIKEDTFEKIVEDLKFIIKTKLEEDTDFIKVNFNKKIIDDNYAKYAKYIDENINCIKNSKCPLIKFSIKYYGYFKDQIIANEQYDTLFNVHHLM